MPIDPLHAFAAAALAAAGAAVQASVGFGLALVAAPLLLLIDPAFVPGPLLIAAIVLTLLVVRRDRRGIDFAGLKFALVGRVIGTFPAAFLVSALSGAVFNVAVSGMVLIGVSMSALGLTVAPSRNSALVAGFLSGIMGTVSAIGGPPMALLYQRAEGARFRGTLAGFLVVGACMSIVGLTAVGRFRQQDVALALILIPGILLGFAASHWLVRWIDQGRLRPAILLLSFVSALAVLWRAVA